MTDLPSYVDPPFAIPIECVLDLPPPPSVNVTRKSHGPGVAATRKWRERAGMHILANGGLRKFPRMPGRFEAIVLVDESSRMDLDNGIKSLLDFVKKLHLIEDDGPRYLRRLVVEWGSAPEGVRLTLRSIA